MAVIRISSCDEFNMKVLCCKHFSKDVVKEGVVNSDDFIIVYFFAEWCGPCKLFKKIYEEVAKEQKDVSLYMLDIDALPTIAAEYGVMSIPTIIGFKNGQEQVRQVGVPSDLAAWIDSNK